MAKNDYYVIAYRILAYLYECLKQGETPSLEYLRPGTDDFPIPKQYWEYVLRHLLEDGYLEGAVEVPVIGQSVCSVKLMSRVMVTPKGIDFLQNNSAMSKAKDFLKSLKETIPGL